MSSPKLFTVVIFFFILQISNVFGADQIFNSCAIDNYTANSPYEAGLNKLMGYLYFQAPSTGFAMGSFGFEPEKPHGLALCRGDISVSDCNACLVNASSDVHKRCPYNKKAMIAYDHCFLKYSNEDFFGNIDNKVMVFLPNTQDASDTVSFNQKTRELLSNLTVMASGVQKMYASGEMDLGGQFNASSSDNKVYGLVQCTRDLSSGDCKQCLDSLIDKLRTCCDGKIGGRILGGSCNIRYETYPFVNNA